MNKINIKRIFRLKTKYRTIRNVKKKMKEFYDIDITIKEVAYYVNKMNFINPLYVNEYSIYKQLIFRIYKYYPNLQKGINYINNKYNFNFNKRSLYKFASTNNIERINKEYTPSKLSKQQELDIINLYNDGYTTTQIAKMYNYKRKESILNVLSKHNITAKKICDIRKDNKLYKDFSLETIDSIEKAYFIGLLATDGNINSDRKYLNLNLTDIDVIKFLSKYINVKYKTIPPKHENHKEKYDILLYGEEYINQCKRIGIFPRKTYTLGSLNLRNYENKYIPYILRGVIDGDGWIRKDGKEFFISSASYDFAKWCFDELTNLGFIELNIRFISNDSKGIYIIRNGNLKNLKLLKNIIYKEDFGMKRKRDRLYEKNVQRS